MTLSAAGLVTALAALAFADSGLIFSEPFNNNSHKWDIADGPRTYSAIQNGRLFLRHKTQGATFFYNNVKLQGVNDFAMEALIGKVSGTDDAPYGLLFGYDLKANRGYFFGLSGKGKGVLLFSDQGNWSEPLISGRIDQGVNRGNAFNKFAVVHQGEATHLFLNDRWIGSRTGLHLYGSLAAIVLQEDMTVEADYLNVYKGMPDIYQKQIEIANEKNKRHAVIFGVKVEPDTVSPAGSFSLRADYIVADPFPGAPGKLEAGLQYTVSKDGKVLFERAHSLEVPNGVKYTFLKKDLIAGKKPGTYEVKVTLKYGPIEAFSTTSLKINS